jgi:predicted phage-related endonuclease
VRSPSSAADGEYSASLDGLTLGGERILEIKCPLKGRDSTLWRTVEAGRLPEHYQWQVQHQLMVTQAAAADIYVFDGTEGIQLEVAPDPNAWPQIATAWDAFMRCVTEAQAPALTASDTRIRDDPEWLSAAAAYLELRTAYDEAQKAFADAKDRLVALTTHGSERGGGLSVTRYWKAGAIDYKKIPELKALDLEAYRGPPREETRITTIR